MSASAVPLLSLVGALHVAPPFGEDAKLTSSRQVASVQAASAYEEYVSARCVPAPDVARSTASPGMKWSTPLPTGSSGMRWTADQVTPSTEELKTMSLAVHRASKRQSSQATNTRPSPAISAVGSGLVRRSPATGWKLTFEIAISCDHVRPPSVELNA